VKSAAKEVYGFLRWRLVPLRYAGKVRRSLAGTPAPAHRFPVTEQIEQDGYAPGPVIAPQALAAMQAIYGARKPRINPNPRAHPFQNMVEPQDYTADHPLMRFAFSRDVLDVADDYFDGRFLLDSIQVLHSWPTEGKLRASQLWHKDFGDSRSLHCVAYLNDVTSDEGGPFTFVDKRDTRRIHASPFIRRISDQRFARELGSGRIRSFHGKAGESVWVDPSVCYHNGSRCRVPRLAIFVTFFSDKPFVAPTEPVLRHRQEILAAAQAIRPDLSPAYLRRLMQL
jgi:hypothetical protein